MSKRKENGEGSVFQVSENKWIAKIRMGTDASGKHVVKQFSGQTEAIVKKKLRDFKKSEDFAEKHIPTNDTVASYFTMWLNEYQYNKLKPLSYDRLESTVFNHIIPNLGGMKMDKVTRDNVQALINKLYKIQKLSYSSVKKVYVALNSCYKHAMISDVVIKNPCLGVVLPNQSESTKEIKSLSQDEVERLKAEIINRCERDTKKCWYGAAYLLILNTGLRMGEALSLKWSDVNFKNKTITVTKNNALVKKRDDEGQKLGGYELVTQDSTKTSSGNRVIPINRSAEEALLALKKDNTTPYVITNSRQKQVMPTNFERSFKALLKSIGIEGEYGIHSLRHTFASLLFANGVDVKIVSKLLGHSSVKITYDIYVHLFDKDIQHITSVLD